MNKSRKAKTKKKTTEKKKSVGRPEKIKNIDYKQVEKLGECGLTDKEIASCLGIAESTLNNYKKEYPEFMESLKRGKEIADSKVIKALFMRATGYSHPDINISNYQGLVTITPIIKHYAPDPTSMIFWLKNRQPDNWKDRTNNTAELPNEEIEALRKLAQRIMAENI